MTKIFFVDDSLFQVTVTTQILLELGYDVTSSRDPLEAIDMICEGDYDCIITDHLMPGMNGFELLAKLKDEKPDLPVILLTSNVQKTVENDAKAAGATCFISKPANKETLAAALEKVMGQ